MLCISVQSSNKVKYKDFKPILVRDRLSHMIDQALEFNNTRDLERYITGYMLYQLSVKVGIKKLRKRA